MQGQKTFVDFKMAFYYYIALALMVTCHAESTDKKIEAESSILDYECKNKYGYYAIEDSCDSYVECFNYKASTVWCPDGLNYNPDSKWPEYPCAYPADIPCVGRKSQLAQPSADCPHQYGYFPSPISTPEDCGHYKLCVGGHAIDMDCPKGLAFNPASSRCDWPHLVASCKNNEYHGFTCPPAPVDENGEVLDTVINYKYPGDCFYFFSCQLGQSRLLSCDPGFAFDPELGRCVDEDFVDCKQDRVILY